VLKATEIIITEHNKKGFVTTAIKHCVANTLMYLQYKGASYAYVIKLLKSNTLSGFNFYVSIA